MGVDTFPSVYDTRYRIHSKNTPLPNPCTIMFYTRRLVSALGGGVDVEGEVDEHLLRLPEVVVRLLQCMLMVWLVAQDSCSWVPQAETAATI